MVSSQKGSAAVWGCCFFEVNFTPDPWCSSGEERWLLVLSPVGTEISVAVEENRGEMWHGSQGCLP